METTSHKPYVRYEDGETLPVFGFRQKSKGTNPLVAHRGSLVPARDYRDEEYEIITKETVVNFENSETHETTSAKEILHG